MRSQAQIVAQLEARYAEIEADAARPERKWPCQTCRHRRGSFCENALITGLDGGKWHWDAGYSSAHFDAALCGLEKALWEPTPATRRWLAAIPDPLMFGILIPFGIVGGVCWLIWTAITLST